MLLLCLLVLSRDTLHGDNKVFNRSLRRLLLKTLTVHETIKSNGSLHEVVKTSENAEDTERVNPDTNNGDHGSLAMNEPTEDTEESGDDVDNEYGTRKFPRRNGRPERTIGTSDENQPVLSKRDLQEKNGINLTKVLDDTTATSKHGSEDNPRTNSKNDSEENRHSPKLRKVPLDRLGRVRSVVVSNGKGSNISENGNEDNKVDIKRLVKNGNPETKEDFQI